MADQAGSGKRAIRASLPAGEDPREAIVGRAEDSGALGWVRLDDDGLARVHAEGSEAAVEAMEDLLR